MLEHAHELIATINQIVPPSAPEEEVGGDGEVDFEDDDDDDDAMEM